MSPGLLRPPACWRLEYGCPSAPAVRIRRRSHACTNFDYNQHYSTTIEGWMFPAPVLQGPLRADGERQQHRHANSRSAAQSHALRPWAEPPGEAWCVPPFDCWQAGSARLPLPVAHSLVLSAGRIPWLAGPFPLLIRPPALHRRNGPGHVKGIQMRGLTAARGGYDVHAEHRAGHGQPQNRRHQGIPASASAGSKLKKRSTNRGAGYDHFQSVASPRACPRGHGTPAD